VTYPEGDWGEVDFIDNSEEKTNKGYEVGNKGYDWKNLDYEDD
jgi:hypothetical protein